MFERFTDRSRKVLVLAQEEARQLNHNFIGTEHVLLGLLAEGEGVAAKALASLGLTLDNARQAVTERIGEAGPEVTTGSPPFTPRAKKVLELSLRQALQLGHNYIGTEHMLLGLVAEGEGVAADVLRQTCGDLAKVRETVVGLLTAFVARPAAETVSSAPLCPCCRISLADNTTYREVEASVEGGEQRPVVLVYCRGCGTALGVAS